MKTVKGDCFSNALENVVMACFMSTFFQSTRVRPINITFCYRLIADKVGQGKHFKSE